MAPPSPWCLPARSLDAGCSFSVPGAPCLILEPPGCLIGCEAIAATAGSCCLGRLGGGLAAFAGLRLNYEAPKGLCVMPLPPMPPLCDHKCQAMRPYRTD